MAHHALAAEPKAEDDRNEQQPVRDRRHRDAHDAEADKHEQRQRPNPQSVSQ
jgi:hypothetical protein